MKGLLLRRRHDETGSAAVFVVMMSFILLVCAGLVVDGGTAINARMRVADDAEQASRVAADSLDIDALRDTGVIVINETLARQRASAYLGNRGYSAGQFSVDVDPDTGTVDVTVRDTTDTIILGLVQIEKYDVEAGAVSSPETEPQP